MPRWLFLVLVTALTLSVVGSVLIVLRSPRDASRTTTAPPAGNAAPTAVPKP
jgi:hypothetical protein